MRLEDITKLFVPVVAAMAIAGCGYFESLVRPSTRPRQSEARVVSVDAGLDTRMEQDADSETPPVAEADVADEDHDLEGQDGCPRPMSELKRANYLLTLRKYHLPLGTDEVRDRELACFGLTKFPDRVLKRYDWYADRGKRVRPFEEAEGERVTKTAPTIPPVPPPTPPAREEVGKIRVVEPVKAAPAKTGSVDSLVIKNYKNDSWTLRADHLGDIRDYVKAHRQEKCFMVTGYAVEGEARKRVSMERAKGVADLIKGYEGRTAKTRTRYKGTGLGRKTVVRAGCQ